MWKNQKSKSMYWCAACAASLMVAQAASADLMKTIGASQDVTLFGGSDATNNDTSSGPGMFVGSDGSSPKRGIIEFDIADNIPAGATITGVTMTLYLGMWAGSAGTGMGGDISTRTIRLFDVTTPWNGSVLGTTGIPGPGFGGQGHGKTPPNTGDATWNWAMFGEKQWTTPGGDFSSTESADTGVTNNLNSAYTWSSTQMVKDVQNWLDDPSTDNGWLLKNDEEAVQSFRAFYTIAGAVEQGVPQFAPSLSITYTLAAPEPASLMLVGAGVSFLLTQRRRQRKLV